jgi:hypothetical protein
MEGALVVGPVNFMRRTSRGVPALGRALRRGEIGTDLAMEDGILGGGTLEINHTGKDHIMVRVEGLLWGSIRSMNMCTIRMHAAAKCLIPFRQHLIMTGNIYFLAIKIMNQE